MKEDKRIDNNVNNDTRILIMYRTRAGEKLARLVLESLRTFGGPLADCQAWIYLPDPDNVEGKLLGIGGLEFHPLEIPAECPPYPFMEKVYACYQAELTAGEDIDSLIWLDLGCLVVNPPLLYELSSDFDVSFRPVHHTNVGSATAEPPDSFWNGIYQALEIDDVPFTVESFADQKILRPYFNTHNFSVRPQIGIYQAWWDYFHRIVNDIEFQSNACGDQLHKIFLHQAILSGLIMKMLDFERIRILPATYNYPLNLQDEIPAERQVKVLNELVTPVYEDMSIHPHDLDGFVVHEPLRSWLIAHLEG